MSQQNFDKTKLIECIQHIDSKLLVYSIEYIQNNSLSFDEEEFFCQVIANYVKDETKRLNKIKNMLRTLYKQLEQDEVEYNK